MGKLQCVTRIRQLAELKFTTLEKTLDILQQSDWISVK